MLTVALRKLLSGHCPLSPGKALLLVVSLTIAWPGVAFCSGRKYPVALMDWMVEGTFHALIVDKSQQRLTVWEIKEGEPSMLESFRCSTGENEGDKWVRGDMRTPEGVYFFCSVIDGRTLPSKYGIWAFTTDYPNFVDRRRGKSGDGIWLHGRDKPLGTKPDSNGCIALENQDLIKVSRFIKLQDTPLIVVKKLKMAPRSAIMEQEREIRDFIDDWRQSWESRNLDAYMGHYSLNFQSSWLDYKAWKEKKRRLNKRYKKIRVRLRNVRLYRQDGLVTATFWQDYKSDSYHSSGIKVLYIIVNNGKYRIYAEDYHKPVDDPFPVGSLLAEINGFPQDKYRVRKNLGIRLVSTDEPDLPVEAEFEAPRPSAPSRGVVLKTIAAAGEIAAPAIESNERFVQKASPDRLTVARIMPAYEPPRYLQSSLNLSDNSTKARAPLKSVSLDRESHGPSEVPGKTMHKKVLANLPAYKPAHRDKSTRIQTNGNKYGKVPEEKKQAAVRDSVKKFLAHWKTAWEQKDLNGFLKMYHPGFRSGALDFKNLAKTKRRYFRKYKTIQVQMERLQIRKVKAGLLVKFVQIFRGDKYSDKGWKSMVLVGGKGKRLRILSEKWSAL